MNEVRSARSKFGTMDEWVLRRSREMMASEMDRRILRYASSRGVRMETTASALLLTQTRYFAMNVGDSWTSKFTAALTQISSDQTIVAKEVARGIMSPEQARVDSRRSILPSHSQTSGLFH